MEALASVALILAPSLRCAFQRQENSHSSGIAKTTLVQKRRMRKSGEPENAHSLSDDSQRHVFSRSAMTKVDSKEGKQMPAPRTGGSP